MTTYLDVTVGDRIFRARVLDGRAEHGTAALLDTLPINAQVVQDEWSRDFMEVVGGPRLEVERSDHSVAFQYPGLLVVDQEHGRLSICYGQARLQDGSGPLRAVPLAEIGGDLSALEAFGRSLQFDGAQSFTITRSVDQETPVAPLEPEGRRLLVTLGDARVSAVLLEAVSPYTTTALDRLLPLVGTATNTVSSGPLTRFWNPAGGPEGETPLEREADGSAESIVSATGDTRQQVLYPGFMYYLPSRPWRGIRVAFREATIMKGILAGESPSLVPLAQFVGDWSAARDAAERLRFVGSTPMRIELAWDT
jgi:hypothetical protein